MINNKKKKAKRPICNPLNICSVTSSEVHNEIINKQYHVKLGGGETEMSRDLNYNTIAYNFILIIGHIVYTKKLT